MGDPIQVQVTQPGYYPAKGTAGYKNPGDVFFINREGDFSYNWMRRISPMPIEAAKAVAPAMKLVEPAVAEPPRQKRKYVRKAKVGE